MDLQTIDPQIIAAIITGISALIGTIMSIYSTLIVAFIVYLVFQLVVNKQKAELEVKIERAKTGLVQAQKDQYAGTWKFIKFINEFVLSAKDFYFTDPLQPIIGAYLQLFNRKELNLIELGLTEKQCNDYKRTAKKPFLALYMIKVPNEEIIEFNNKYAAIMKEYLGGQIIKTDIKERGKLLYENIINLVMSDSFRDFKHELVAGESQNDPNEFINYLINANNIVMKDILKDQAEIIEMFNRYFQIS